MNVGTGVRLAASVSYRYLANPEIPGLDSAAVSGVAGGIAVKVGTF